MLKDYKTKPVTIYNYKNVVSGIEKLGKEPVTIEPSDLFAVEYLINLGLSDVINTTDFKTDKISEKIYNTGLRIKETLNKNMKV